MNTIEIARTIVKSGEVIDGATPTKLYSRKAREVAQSLLEANEVMEKLARLGNGEQYGNSEGNMIARRWLEKHNRR
jgi:hypothetical protein